LSRTDDAKSFDILRRNNWARAEASRMSGALDELPSENWGNHFRDFVNK